MTKQIELNRIFIAIELPSHIHDDLTTSIQLINSKKIDSLRTIKQGSAHITIKFLGEIKIVDIPLLTNLIRDHVVGMNEFKASINNFKLHPNSSDPRFAYFDVGRSPQLTELNLSVGEACKIFGAKPDTRNWFPHITIARIQRTKSRSERRLVGEHLTGIPDFRKTLLVSNFSIMSSHLSQSGPNYRTVKRIQLAPKPSN